MKIKVFVTIDESWDGGDLNSTHKKYFTTKELRDDYFENVLRPDYVKNQGLEEYRPGHFCDPKGFARWSYVIDKDEETLDIIEEKTW